MLLPFASMRYRLWRCCCAAILGFSLVASAAHASELDCMASAVTPSQMANTNTVAREFAEQIIGMRSDPQVGERLSAIVTASVEGCRRRHGWDDGAVAAANLHEIGRLIEIGAFGRGVLSPESITRYENMEILPEFWGYAIKFAFAEILGVEQSLGALEQLAFEGMFAPFDAPEAVALRTVTLGRALQLEGKARMQAQGRS